MEANQLFNEIFGVFYNSQKPVSVFTGVISAELELNIDGGVQGIPRELFTLPESLTKHKKNIKIKINSVTNDAEIEFTEGLKSGDRVIGITVQGGQQFHILDRLVRLS